MEVLGARYIAARAHIPLMGFWEEGGWKGRFKISSEMGIPEGPQGLGHLLGNFIRMCKVEDTQLCLTSTASAPLSTATFSLLILAMDSDDPHGLRYWLIYPFSGNAFLKFFFKWHQ